MQWIPVLPFLLFAYRRLLTYLHIFQQDEYDAGRFLKWLWSHKAFDRKVSAAMLIVILAAFLIKIPHMEFGASILLAVIFFVGFFLEPNPTKKAKKKLVLTTRARRILGCAILAEVLIIAGVVGFSLPLIAWLVALQLIPLSLPLAALLTGPIEKRIQKGFWHEAHDKLTTLNPKVIAITGSFGKTSVKHLIGHILQSYAQVLITPGSVNTPMGIARIIREQLGAHHKYFVCEMGAYGPGSIARLCDLSPPSIGVITIIGQAHYERFKSLDVVAQTKFELADAVIEKKGKVIINSDVLSFEYPKETYRRTSEAFTTVGDKESDSIRIVSQSQSPDGTKLRIAYAGSEFDIICPLFGEHQAMNIALSFALALQVGISPEHIVRALKSAPQTAHRLEVKRQTNGVTILDDAYNSNPVGFASALRLLSVLRTNESGRRILVTPGMVELGEAHDEEHQKIGKIAAREVDILISIREGRIQTLVDAFLAGRPKDSHINCDTFAEASQWIDANARDGDVILIENDLPDLYEQKLKL